MTKKTTPRRKPLPLGRMLGWKQIVDAVADAGWLLHIEHGMIFSSYSAYSLELDVDHGTIEAYGWDAARQSGVMVAQVTDSNHTLVIL